MSGQVHVAVAVKVHLNDYDYAHADVLGCHLELTRAAPLAWGFAFRTLQNLVE